MTAVLLLAEKELRDARRNRWFLLYAAVFAGLALAVAWTALAGAGAYGVAGFTRTSAGLLNLVLLVVPLMGLTLGAGALAGERERGTLLYLLSQPVSPWEVLLGKYLGLALALTGALALGFGAAGLALALRGGLPQVGDYLALVGLAVFLAWASLAVGFLISAPARRSATALGIALFAWLFLAFFTDLGLMGTALTRRLSVQALFLAAIANPLQAFKVATVLVLRGNLEVLGPAGVYAVRAWGSALAPMLMGVLAGWTLLPLALALWAFHRRGGVV